MLREISIIWADFQLLTLFVNQIRPNRIVNVSSSITTTPPGWDASPSQDTQHKVNRSITTTPPGWDASPSQGYQQLTLNSSGY